MGVALALGAGLVRADDFVRLGGAACVTPAYLKCPDEGCITDRVINPGPVVEMESRRT